MRKVVLFVLLNLGFLSANAQTSFGIVAGLKNATQRTNRNNDGSRNYLLWQAGVTADIPLTGRFCLQPQLLASVKGSHGEMHDLDSNYIILSGVSTKLRLMYLELPLNVVYKHPLGAGKLVVGAGPYLAYGLGGKRNSTYTYKIDQPTEHSEIKVKFKNKPEWGARYEYHKPLDAGLNFLAGYELNNGLCFNINYSLGLTNIEPADATSPDGTRYIYGTTRNSYLGITAGYFLRKYK